MRNIDLAGEWILAQWEDGERIADTTVPMQIPGDTFSALIIAGKIPDPSFGINRLSIQCSFIGGQPIFSAIQSFIDPLVRKFGCEG